MAGGLSLAIVSLFDSVQVKLHKAGGKLISLVFPHIELPVYEVSFKCSYKVERKNIRIDIIPERSFFRTLLQYPRQEIVILLVDPIYALRSFPPAYSSVARCVKQRFN